MIMIGPGTVMSKAGSVIILLRALWLEPHRRAKPSRRSLKEPLKVLLLLFRQDGPSHFEQPNVHHHGYIRSASIRN